MVPTSSRGHADELAECPERDQTNQHNRGNASQQKPGCQDRIHQPPRLNSLLKHTNNGRIDGALRLATEKPTNQVQNRQDRNDHAQQNHHTQVAPIPQRRRQEHQSRHIVKISLVFNKHLASFGWTHQITSFRSAPLRPRASRPSTISVNTTMDTTACAPVVGGTFTRHL